MSDKSQWPTEQLIVSPHQFSIIIAACDALNQKAIFKDDELYGEIFDREDDRLAEFMAENFGCKRGVNYEIKVVYGAGR